MQADHQQRGGFDVQRQTRVRRAEQGNQFIVDDLDDLLARLNALNDLLPDGFFFDAVNEIARYLEINVGVQQRQAHVAERVGNVGFGDLSQTAKVSEHVLELAAQRVEHEVTLRGKDQASKWKVSRPGRRHFIPGKLLRLS